MQFDQIFLDVTNSFKINRPHLAYTILGGFTSVFMLCSLFIKEKLYIGEASEFRDSQRCVHNADWTLQPLLRSVA
jgi:hypothetical protein